MLNVTITSLIVGKRSQGNSEFYIHSYPLYGTIQFNLSLLVKAVVVELVCYNSSGADNDTVVLSFPVNPRTIFIDE